LSINSGQFLKWKPDVESFGLRRQAERDAALDRAAGLGCHQKALSPLCFASAVQKPAQLYEVRFKHLKPPSCENN